MTNVLVTGGAGYLGSILVPALLERGFSVSVIDNFMYGQDSLAAVCYHPNFTVVRGDVRSIETMRPLVFAPLPGGPARQLFAPVTIAADLDRLANGQEDDGGWRVDFASYSPAAEVEWRGHMTVRAVSILKRNGRL